MVISKSSCSGTTSKLLSSAIVKTTFLLVLSCWCVDGFQKSHLITNNNNRISFPRRRITRYQHEIRSAAAKNINDWEEPPNEKELSDLTIFANELADIARESILPYWRLPPNALNVENKFEDGRSVSQTNSPVTIADKLAEKNIRKAIENRFPDHGICGEEYGSVRLHSSKWTWVLDPIDGTKSFIAGKPLFGTLIACLYEGIPVIGIIDQCVLDERWVGIYNQPSTFNGNIIESSKAVTELSRSMLFCTTPDMFKSGYEQNGFHEISRRCLYTNYGTDCYGYALVASGYDAHIVVEADLGLYDYCAIVPVIQGSGGIMTDWTGNSLSLQNHESKCKGRVVACANSVLHKQAIEILNHQSDQESQ